MLCLMNRLMCITPIIYSFITGIECPSLIIANGAVIYAPDNVPQFDIGTVATHSCNPDFGLVGEIARTCLDDDQADIDGVWSGNPSTCERMH